MNNWKNKIAIVTGASAGIGAAIAEELVKTGVTVVGLARRKERVEELAKKLENNTGKLFAVKTDISKEQDILAAFKWVKDNLGPVSILINNAGVVKPTDLSNGDTQMWKATLDINVLGLCIGTREAIQDMKTNNINGQIIHINSTLGHHLPHLANINMYPASKFAVTALTEILRQELCSAGSKIKITSISPGIVDTEILEANNVTPSTQLQKSLEGIKVLEPKDIADAVLHVLSTPPHVQIQELIIRPVGTIV